MWLKLKNAHGHNDGTMINTDNLVSVYFGETEDVDNVRMYPLHYRSVSDDVFTECFLTPHGQMQRMEEVQKMLRAV